MHLLGGYFDMGTEAGLGQLRASVDHFESEDSAGRPVTEELVQLEMVQFGKSKFTSSFGLKANVF